MNDNQESRARILSFRKLEPEEPTGEFHYVEVWQCNCGGTVFTYTLQDGLVCEQCSEPQRGL